MSGPSSLRSTPLHRWAAAGANTSRPANVAPGAPSWYSALVSSTARSAPPAIATAGASSPLSGPMITPAPSATSIATARASGADARIDDRQHDAARHVRDAPRQRERTGADVERRDLVGEVDDGDVRCEVTDDRLDHADELVGGAVVGEERDGVEAVTGHVGDAICPLSVRSRVTAASQCRVNGSKPNVPGSSRSTRPQGTVAAARERQGPVPTPRWHRPFGAARLSPVRSPIVTVGQEPSMRKGSHGNCCALLDGWATGM